MSAPVPVTWSAWQCVLSASVSVRPSAEIAARSRSTCARFKGDRGRIRGDRGEIAIDLLEDGLDEMASPSP